MRVDDPTETDESADLEVTSTSTSTSAPRRATAKRWAPVVLGILVLAIATLAVIGPVRESGYTGDDAVNFLFRDYLREGDSTPYEHFRFYTEDWMEKQGRFFPGAVAEGTAVWWFLDTHSLYKGFQFLVVALNLLLLALVVRQLSRQWAPAFLAVAIVLSSIQFRLYHDPVLSFSGLLPVAMGAILGTFLVLGSWQRHGWWWLLPGAVLLWTFALTAYEIAYLLTPAVLLYVWLVPGDRQRRIVSSAIVLVPTTILFGIVMSLRDNAEQLAPAYTTRVQISKILPTAVYQLVGAIPGNVPAFRTDPSLGELIEGHEVGFALLTAMVAIAVGLAVARSRPVTGRTQLVLVFLGLSLWVMPVLTIAVTQRWQDELGFGTAYLGVYFESFGFALLVVASVLAVVGALRHLPPRFVNPSRLAFAIIIGVMVGSLVATTARNNQWVVNAYGKPERVRQTTLEYAAGSGLYEILPAGTTLYPVDQVAWFNPTFLRANGTTTIETIGTISALATPPAATVAPRCALGPAPFQAAVAVERADFVVLARADAVTPAPPPAPYTIGTSVLRVLVPDRTTAPEFSGREYGVVDAPLEPLPPATTITTDQVDGGVLVDICLRNSLIDAQSLTYD